MTFDRTMPRNVVRVDGFLREQMGPVTRKLGEAIAYAICQSESGRIEGVRGFAISWETLPGSNYSETKVSIDT